MEFHVTLNERRTDSQPPQNRFDRTLADSNIGLPRKKTTFLQINVGKLCNQACTHCHVEAGPKRTEIMGWPVMERLLELAAQSSVTTVDLTGGAPEMNPHFSRLVEGLSAQGKEIIVRSNLTILVEEGYESLPAFYARNGVHLVCSLPCYTPENVSKQRGSGAFEKSIAALQRLNAVGYGVEEHPTGLRLDLVYNPGGAFLPGSQQKLEADYRRELGTQFGVRFSHLLTLANLPIGRFGNTLKRGGGYDAYVTLLEKAFNPETVPHLMCRNMLNVGWEGRIYDCDFNQMLDLQLGNGGPSIFDPDFSLDQLLEVPIRTGDHCLGCTAGAGSSCGGALV